MGLMAIFYGPNGHFSQRLGGLWHMPGGYLSRVNYLEFRQGDVVRRNYYQEDKRCMLAFLKSAADFSRGCAHLAMQPPISATHPTHAQRKRAGAPAMGLRPEEDH
jgi:hypothetical protein